MHAFMQPSLDLAARSAIRLPICLCAPYGEAATELGRMSYQDAAVEAQHGLAGPRFVVCEVTCQVTS